MISAPVPADEARRLQILQHYAILDTLAEQAYDDITKLASYICDTPVAMISLVDSDRQWFKSRVGVDTQQTPREIAFCAHAILEPEQAFVVNDAAQDERFFDSPLVLEEPHVRFYAGVPLVAPGGEALGTICVVDRKPRQLEPKQLDALRVLSRQVMTQMELRRLAAELEAYSATDGLTGLNNRRALDQRLQEELQRRDRSGSTLSFALIDIDHFKTYNDQFGHLAGDDTLRQVAHILHDTVRPYDFLARYGGEEFAVILPNTDAEQALTIAERLRQAIESAAWPRRPVTVSAGVASMATEQTATALMEAADTALYRAKRLGRNQVRHAAETPSAPQ
jgi:diguanylate cyclase (GGDEF)-like protein